MSVHRPPAPLIRSLTFTLALLVLMAAGAAGAADAAGPGVAALDATLTADDRATLDGPGGSVGLPRTIGPHGAIVDASLATFEASPGAVRSLVAKASSVPDWLELHAGFKRVRVQGASRMVADVGSLLSGRSSRRMLLDVDGDDSMTTWRLAQPAGPLLAGTSVTFEVIAHPRLEGASLVLQRRATLVRGGTGDPALRLRDDGAVAWWGEPMDARRLFWAMDAALRFPPGRERRAAYLELYQRGQFGALPWWSKPGASRTR